tara:strand:- start:6712 stop:8439 length:1728 start_codon:yes stop_codon:yes gene_type:complete
MKRELILSLEKKYKNIKKPYYLDYQYFYSNRNLDKSCFASNLSTSNKKKQQCIKEANRIARNIFFDLYPQLNSIHGLKKSKRFWDIIISPWIQAYTFFYYREYHSIQYALKKSITKVISSNYETYDFTSIDTQGAIEKFTDQTWLLMFRSRVVDQINRNIKKQKVNFIQKQEREKNALTFKFFLSKLYNKINIFNKRDNFFIYDSYLSLKDEFFLNIHLGQAVNFFAKLRVKLNSKKSEKNKSIRDMLFKKKDEKKIVKALKASIKQDIPTIFLEDLKMSVKLAASCNWPIKPKLIFTSNAFFSDELFKFYLAQKIEDGSKYVVGQHGNNYITNSSADYTTEYRTSDFFLNWGKSTKKKEIEFCNFITKKIDFKNPKKNNILIINKTIGVGAVPFEYNYLRVNYLISIEKFTKNLLKFIKYHIYVKPHGGYVTRNPSEKKYFQKINNINLVDSSDLIYKNIKKIRPKIVVFTYYSTGFLELVTSNTPCIFFDYGEMEIDLKKKYKPLFNLMERHNLYFKNLKKLEIFLNNNKDNFEKWWLSKEIYNLRAHISQNLSKRKNSNSIRQLSDIFKKLI